MSTSLQTVIALSLVALTVITFFYRWLQKPKKSGCGGGCGCSSSQIKIQHGRKKAD